MFVIEYRVPPAASPVSSGELLMYLVMVCKDVNLVCKVGTLTIMPLPGDFLAGHCYSTSLHLKGSKVVQQEQLI